jgi:hypothetical protein
MKGEWHLSRTNADETSESAGVHPALETGVKDSRVKDRRLFL